MALKRLTQFLHFDWESFSADKQFSVTDCREWVDHDTKMVIGTKVEAVIINDKTKYIDNNGDILNTTNRYSSVTFKVGKRMNIPVNSLIKPLKVKAKVYGQYNECLSIKCEDIQIVNP